MTYIAVLLDYSDREAIAAAWESAAMPLGDEIDNKIRRILDSYDEGEAEYYRLSGQSEAE